MKIALFNSPKYLQPLQGDVVPRLITVLADPGSLSQVYELPHRSFWIEASFEMPIVLKERCIEALRKLHACGILHGDLKLRDVIIGGDGHVTIKRFFKSRALVPDTQSGLKAASPEELELEMRKLRFMLDYDDAQEKEQQRITQALRHGEAEGHVESLIDHISFDEWSRWLRSRQLVSKRYIVPGQSADDVRTAVGNFIILVKKLEAERVRTPTTEASTAAESSTAPASSTATDPLHYSSPAGPSRKRALPESTDAPPRKRLRTPDSGSMSSSATPDHSLPHHPPEQRIDQDPIEDHPFFRLKERFVFTDEERVTLLRHALIRERTARECHHLNLPHVDRCGRIRGRRASPYALGGLLRDLADAVDPAAAEELSRQAKNNYRLFGKLGSGEPNDGEDSWLPQGPPVLTRDALESRRRKGKGRPRYAPLGILRNSGPGPVDEEAMKSQDEVKLDGDDLRPWRPRPTISLQRSQIGLGGPDTRPGTEEGGLPQPPTPAFLSVVRNRQLDPTSSRDKVKISREISTASVDYCGGARDALTRLCASLPGGNIFLGMWHRWTE